MPVACEDKSEVFGTGPASVPITGLLSDSASITGGKAVLYDGKTSLTRLYCDWAGTYEGYSGDFYADVYSYKLTDTIGMYTGQQVAAASKNYKLVIRDTFINKITGGSDNANDSIIAFADEYCEYFKTVGDFKAALSSSAGSMVYYAPFYSLGSWISKSSMLTILADWKVYETTDVDENGDGLPDIHSRPLADDDAWPYSMCKKDGAWYVMAGTYTASILGAPNVESYKVTYENCACHEGDEGWDNTDTSDGIKEINVDQKPTLPTGSSDSDDGEYDCHWEFTVNGTTYHSDIAPILERNFVVNPPELTNEILTSAAELNPSTGAGTISAITTSVLGTVSSPVRNSKVVTLKSSATWGLIKAGMSVKFSSGGRTVSATISSVNQASNQITLSSAVSLDSGALLMPEISYNYGYSSSGSGASGMLASTSLFGLDAGTLAAASTSTYGLEASTDNSALMASSTKRKLNDVEKQVVLEAINKMTAYISDTPRNFPLQSDLLRQLLQDDRIRINRSAGSDIGNTIAGIIYLGDKTVDPDCFNSLYEAVYDGNEYDFWFWKSDKRLLKVRYSAAPFYRAAKIMGTLIHELTHYQRGYNLERAEDEKEAYSNEMWFYLCLAKHFKDLNQRNPGTCNIYQVENTGRLFDNALSDMTQQYIPRSNRREHFEKWEHLWETTIKVPLRRRAV